MQHPSSVLFPKLCELESGSATDVRRHGTWAWGSTSMQAYPAGLFPRPLLQTRAHICSPSGRAEEPDECSGKGSLSVGIIGLAWTAKPSSQAQISGETQPSGLPVREASGLDFQIPESSLLGLTLCLISLQGPLMNRYWICFEKDKTLNERQCWPWQWA